MKTAIPASWHSGAAGVRVFGQLSEYAHLLRTDDATDLDNPEAVFEVVKRAAKNTKSVARSVQELEQLEARRRVGDWAPTAPLSFLFIINIPI